MLPFGEIEVDEAETPSLQNQYVLLASSSADPEERLTEILKESLLQSNPLGGGSSRECEQFFQDTLCPAFRTLFLKGYSSSAKSEFEGALAKRLSDFDLSVASLSARAMLFALRSLTFEDAFEFYDTKSRSFDTVDTCPSGVVPRILFRISDAFLIRNTSYFTRYNSEEMSEAEEVFKHISSDELLELCDRIQSVLSANDVNASKSTLKLWSDLTQRLEKLTSRALTRPSGLR